MADAVAALNTPARVSIRGEAQTLESRNERSRNTQNGTTLEQQRVNSHTDRPVARRTAARAAQNPAGVAQDELWARRTAHRRVPTASRRFEPAAAVAAPAVRRSAAGLLPLGRSSAPPRAGREVVEPPRPACRLAGQAAAVWYGIRYTADAARWLVTAPRDYQFAFNARGQVYSFLRIKIFADHLCRSPCL
jgi:hypothetical protein